MIMIRHEKSSDASAREALLDVAYGPARFGKTSHRLREGRAPAAGLSFVAIEDGRVIGTLRLWPVTAGPSRPALLLGPLAVHPDARQRGVGSDLVRRALQEARRRGHGAVLLVGDSAFYGRFGFSAAPTGRLWMPGPYEPHRLLGLELADGALHGATGPIGTPRQAAPRLAPLVAALRGRKPQAA
jgi:predicted N-acetyltransferase YhbS